MKLLSQLLEEVTQNVPFYSDYIGCNIEELPVISKIDIQDDYRSFINQRLDVDNVLEQLYTKMKLENYIIEKELEKVGVFEWTTGSSGIPFKCFKSFEERNRMSLNLWKNRRKMYRDIVPEKFFPLIHTGREIPRFDVRDYTDANLKGIYNYILEKKFNCIHTTPTLLNRHFLDSGVNLDFFKYGVKYIESTGSYLDDKKRDIFESITGAQIINSYGLIETWTIALTCKERFMHVFEDGIYLELFADNGEKIVDCDVYGELVITSLYLTSMPIIRYRTGDYARFVEGACSCGNTNRRIELQKNRKINYISIDDKKKDGIKLIKKVLKRVFWNKDYEYISSFCVQQVDIKSFKIYYIKFAESKAFMDTFNHHLKQEVGDYISIESVEVTKVEFDKLNPKNHLFISML